VTTLHSLLLQKHRTRTHFKCLRTQLEESRQLHERALAEADARVSVQADALTAAHAEVLSSVSSEHAAEVDATS